jgi:hypothetical protein
VKIKEAMGRLTATSQQTTGLYDYQGITHFAMLYIFFEVENITIAGKNEPE